MDDKDSDPGAISREHLTKVLNLRGEGFHYAVVRAIVTASADDRWAWRVEEVEVPVEVRGGPTHIDILLKHASNPMYIVAECKRANPRLSRWCFFKAPYADSGRILVEVTKDVGSNRFMAGMHNLGSGDTCHIPIEVKTQDQGDPTGSKGRGAIEDAATQVMRHLNGFVGLIAGARQLLAGFQQAFILPVIFTTARLFTCDSNLSQADLFNGCIDLEGSSIKEVPWLYYQYNQSPGLKHEVRSQHSVGSLHDFIMAEFSRTIAVVNANGIESFLAQSARLL